MSEENVSVAQTVVQPDLWESLIVRGLNVVLTRPNEHNTKLDIIRNHPDMLLPRLETLDITIQTNMVEGMLAENPSVLIQDEGWWGYVCRAIERLENSPPLELFNNTGLYVLLNRVKDLKVEVDWKNILSKLSELTIAGGSKCQGFSTVLNWLTEADPENLRELLYRTETKSYPSNLKVELYKQAINLGLLDNKLARRIRSDSSGALSSELLAYLFENRSVFPDEIFQDLVTQFSDTKHKWVARYIAMNMPMHLVPFLMGIKDDAALKIMEKRMELAEEENNG
jgi:hypothetical protein